MTQPPRVRIAPSPTGDPHVGTAYVGLINYAFARRNGGRFILRIEDTDRERSSAASEAAILDALHWLGLSWDEGPDVGGPCGPYRQSERSEIYREHARILLERGAAYPCFCTPAQLAAIRERQRAAKQNKGYDGTCRRLPPDEARRRMESGEPHTIRLAMPLEGETAFQDHLRGDVSYANDQMDDQVLLKSDGFPTYHLANVVDDHLMGITHVIRAEEWLNSTPKHVVLYRAFGWDPPVFVHLPLLRNADRSKISKRKNPVSLDFYRRVGILPEVLLNFLALLGHSMPDEREVFTLDDFVREFSFERMHLGGPVFDLDKLLWLNGHYVRAMDPRDLARRIRDTVFSIENIEALVPLIRERVDALGEFPEKTWYFTHPKMPVPAQELAGAVQGRAPKEAAKALKAAHEALNEAPSFDAEALEVRMRDLAASLSWKPGDLFMLVRIAATGRKATPPLFDTLVAIGRPAVAQRLRAAVEALGRLKE